jgi:RNA polymerase sigma-70 factor (ECF subfamily)
MGVNGVARSSDEELLRAVQAGDTDSLGVLVARWEQPLFRFVYRLMPRREDARDVCQETFLRILKKANRFRAGSRFSTWMYQIALNLCRDQARRARRWNLVIAATAELPDRAQGPLAGDPAAGDPSQAVARQEKSSAVLRVLDRLPPEQREVLVLKEFEGLKFREIAEILDCPESTVKSRMYYGLSGVKTALIGEGITEA